MIYLYIHQALFLSVYSEPGLIMDTEDPAVKVMFPVGKKKITSSE